MFLVNRRRCFVLMASLLLAMTGIFPAYAQDRMTNQSTISNQSVQLKTSNNTNQGKITQFVKKNYPNLLISHVTVIDKYLMANWQDKSGYTGGNILWHYNLQTQKWDVLNQSGGALLPQDLEAYYGVPASIATQLSAIVNN